jgi:hypothetical protein
MTSRRRKWIGLAAIIAAAAIAVALWQNLEPRHQGKTLTEWAEAYHAATASDDYTEWKTKDVLAASNAIVQIGPRAAPWVMRWSRERRSPLVNWLNEQWNRLMPDDARWEPPDGPQEKASLIASLIPEHLKIHIPEMLRMVRSEDDTEWMGWDLLHILGTNALAAKVELAGNTDERIRGKALDLIMRCGTNTISVSSFLWNQLDVETNRTLQSTLLLALVSVGNEDDKIILQAGTSFLMGLPDEKEAQTLAALLRFSGKTRPA